MTALLSTRGRPSVGCPKHLPCNGTFNFAANTCFSFRHKPIGNMSMKKFYTLKDLMVFRNESEPTLRRRHAESLAGIGNFPRSVNAPGKKLLFRAEDVESWAATGRPPLSVPDIESASQRSKRHAAAMRSLQKKGVKIGKAGTANK